MRRKSVGWHYCTESRLDLPIVWWEVSPSFLCTPEFGPSGGRRGKRNKGYPVLGCVVSHEDLEDFLEKGCTFMCQAASRISPPPHPGILPFCGPLPHCPSIGTAGWWCLTSEIRSQKRLQLHSLSFFLSLMTCPGWIHYGGSSGEGCTWWGAKPPANSHMDNLGNELHPTPDKPSDETIAQLATLLQLHWRPRAKTIQFNCS